MAIYNSVSRFLFIPLFIVLSLLFFGVPSAAFSQSTTVLDIQVSSSADDAYHDPDSPNYPGYSHSDIYNGIYAGNPALPGVATWGGFRWTNLNIPAGSTIANAYIEFNQKGWGYQIPTVLSFENSANPATFSSTSSPYNRWSNKTLFTLGWTWTRAIPGTWIRTPSIASGIQELVERYGAINSIVLLENGSGVPAGQYHNWESYDNSPLLSARLHIEYLSGVDTTPPVRSNGAPTGTFPSGTTQTTLSLTTNENATCKYGTVAGVTYANIPSTFTVTGGTSHSNTVTGLTNGTSYTFFVRCQDTAGNVNVSDYVISFTVNTPDSTPPVFSNGQPTGTLQSGTTQTTLSVTTNENATCRYSQTAGTAYDAMSNTFTTTSTTAHSSSVVGLTNDTAYTFYLKCKDIAENVNQNDYSISFSVLPDTTPPVRSNGLPTGILPSGTIQTNLSLITNENSTCKYGTVADTAYSSIANTFTTTGSTSHSAIVTGLVDNTTYSYYVRCQDTLGNTNTNDYQISFSISPPGPIIVNAQISASTDDAYHDPEGFWPGYSSSATRVLAGNPGTSGQATFGGWRWNNLNIPNGAIIANAWVEFTQSEWGYKIPTVLSFENSGNPLTFLPTSTPAQRWQNKTTFQLNWTWPMKTPDTVIVTPSLKAGIQELVNRFGGINSIVLLEDGTGVLSGQSHSWYSYDSNPLKGGKLHVEYTIGSPAPDAFPPIRSNGEPSGTLAAGTTQAILSLSTNEQAICRYSTVVGVAFASMTNNFTNTNSTAHATTLSGLRDSTSYTFYVRCQDGTGNVNTDDYQISFQVSSIGVLPMLGNWDGSTAQYSNVWGDGNFAYIGHHYEFRGVDIIDITNPATPILAANWNWTTPISVWSIRVKNGIAYLSDQWGGNGLFILNVTNPYSPQLLSRITAANGGHNNPYGADIEGNFLYIPSNRNLNVHVFDVSNPSNPVKVRTIVPPGQKVHDVTVKNGKLITSAWSITSIFDVSNVAQGAPLLATINSPSVTAHSSAVSDDGKYLAIENEDLSCINGTHNGEITIYNITNPASPQLASRINPLTYGFGTNSVHYAHFVGNRLYASWLGAGMKVFDIANIANPVLMGSFDTTIGYNAGCADDGNWGVYPHIGPNRILASDWKNGLFILDASSLIVP